MAQAVVQGVGGAALWGEAEVGKGGEKVGRVSGNDKVREGNNCGREAYHGPVEGDNKDLRMAEEGVCDGKVAGAKVVGVLDTGAQKGGEELGIVGGLEELEDNVVCLDTFGVDGCAGAEELAGGLEERDGGGGLCGGELHELLETAVLGLGQAVELVWVFERDDGCLSDNLVCDVGHGERVGWGVSETGMRVVFI